MLLIRDGVVAWSMEVVVLDIHTTPARLRLPRHGAPAVTMGLRLRLHNQGPALPRSPRDHVGLHTLERNRH